MPIVTKEGTKEECDSFVEEIKGQGHTIVSQVYLPTPTGWMITVSYIDEDLTE